MRAVMGWLLLWASWQCAAANLIPVTIALPGPGALPMLPVDLMTRIGADREAGLQVTLRYFGGGPLAIKDMMAGNSDFSALGFSALAETEGIEGKAYSVASLVRVPAYTLMVKRGLKDRIKTPADLRGRSIGVHSGSKAGKSTGQHIVEFLLTRAGVSPQDVNFVSAGQNYPSYSASLQSGAVDALITNEPSATKLEAAGIAYRLVDLHNPAATRRHFGSLFQYTQLTTRADVIRDQTDKVNRVVAALLRSLNWIKLHSAKEIADRMGIKDPKEYEVFVRALGRNKDMFSPDGVFSPEQLQGTATLLRALSDDKRLARPLDRFIDDRWVGRQP